MRRLVFALVIGLLVGAPLAAFAGTPAGAFATVTPTPTPSSGAGAGIGVTIGGSGSGSGTGSPGGGSGAPGGHHGGGSTGKPTPPTPPGVPKKPEIPPVPTITSHRLALNHTTFSSGQTLVATGANFTPGERVQFVFYPGATPVKSFAADSAGTVRATFVLAGNLAVGTHTIEATGWQSVAVESTDFSVVSAAHGVGGATRTSAIVWSIGGAAGAAAIGLGCAVALGWFPRRTPNLLSGR